LKQAEGLSGEFKTSEEGRGLVTVEKEKMCKICCAVWRALHLSRVCRRGAIEARRRRKPFGEDSGQAWGSLRLALRLGVVVGNCKEPSVWSARIWYS